MQPPARSGIRARKAGGKRDVDLDVVERHRLERLAVAVREADDLQRKTVVGVEPQPVAMHAVHRMRGRAGHRHTQRGPAADRFLAFGHRRAALLQRLHVAQQLADVRPVDPVAAVVAYQRIGRRQRQRRRHMLAERTQPDLAVARIVCEHGP
jgi:hypothetical protein